MLVREITISEKEAFNAAATHPLQTWEWGEFRKKTGQKIVRLGIFDTDTLKTSMQISFHDLPLVGKTVGYLPKGPEPTEDQLAVLHNVAQKENALFIKLEPNVFYPAGSDPDFSQQDALLKKYDGTPGRVLFTPYSLILDLTPSEDELFENLQSKTRYNVRLAKKKGVEVWENTSAEGMEEYLNILQETTKRQQFYAHTPDYFRTMWQELGSSGMLRIFEARYENTVLASWIIFLHKGTLYYPYGASRAIHRNVMASNLLMWEMIRFGKTQNCTSFDMWGSLGPDPDTKHPWYGFHKFKLGYNSTLMRFLGTYDLVEDQFLYSVFRKVENLRWKYLRLRARLGV